MGGKVTQQGFRLFGQKDGAALEFILRRGENRVGAVPGSQVTLHDPSVSRNHALIRWVGENILVEDLGSRNGTLLNGRLVKTATLRPGDVLSFGSVELALGTVDPEEAELALPMGSTPPPGKVLQDQSAGKTSPVSASAVPGRWLGILADCAGHLAAGPEADLRQCLEKLVNGIDASGAALVELGAGKEMAILETVGSFQATEVYPKLERYLESCETSSLEDGRISEAGFLPGQPPLAVVVVPNDGGQVGGLAVIGDYPHRLVSNDLLAAVARLIQDRSGSSRPASRHGHSYRPELVFPAGFIPGRSAACQEIHSQLLHLLQGNLPVLVVGETGVGKEHVARILHVSSDRRHGPFVAVNCAAIPSELMEAELFGIEKGVATGVAQRDGKFRLAHGGVLFLDEIGDMPAHLQAKVLRALQDRTVWPVGARQAIAVDVRVVSSTNRDLAERMRVGAFRQDLYYRIAGYILHLPSLRQRREDIPLLVGRFMERFAREAEKRIRGITTKALRALCEAPWPGNVRELENEVRHLVYVCPDGQPVTSAMLRPDFIGGAALAPEAGSLEPSLLQNVEDAERRTIAAAIARTGGNRSQAARLLGVSRNGLTLKMKRLGLIPGTPENSN